MVPRKWMVLAVTAWGLAGAAPGSAQEQTPAAQRERPIRVGNTNLLIAGGGYAQHDLETFDRHGFVNIGMQTRVLRRQTRWVPFWARAAVNYWSKNQDFENAYTIWPGSEYQNGINLGPEPLIQERTSDFAIRVELLSDLLHGANAALYGGAGFVVHVVSFTSRGTVSQRTFDETTSELAPSLVAGTRWFMAKQPYTIYAEARYGRVYGPPVKPTDLPLSAEDWALISTNMVTFEGGLGLHW